MPLRAMSPMVADADRALARRCATGDRAAQAKLYRSEVQRVFAIFYRIIGSSHHTEDLVQETFIRVFRSLPQFRGEAQLSTWIGRIALTVAYDHLRKKRPTLARLEALPDLPSDDASVEERVLAQQGLRRLYEILDRIEPKQRIAFTLHRIDGRPLAEVAELMSASLVATKTRLWRATRQIESRAQRDPLLASFIGTALGEEP